MHDLSRLTADPGVTPTGVDRCQSLCDQLFVAIVGTDPEPDQALGAIPRQRTDAQADASGPEGPDFLESQRRMARVGLEQLEAPVGQRPGFRRQAAIMEPELRCGEVVQGISGVQRPASSSSSARRPAASRRPAKMSASIRWSH